jgi:hypothetical protein
MAELTLEGLMIRALTDRERATLNLEQPGARVTTDLTSENCRYENLRRNAVTDRVLAAQWRARRKATP